MNPSTSPTAVHALERRRQAILEQMSQLRCMRPGSLTPQYQPVVREGQSTEDRRGPYYVWTCKVKGRTVSRRLTSPEEVTRVQTEVDNHQRYVALSREFMALTQELGELEQARDAAREQEKKRRKSPSPKTRRSNAS